jgi:predicted AAA+ superfamily ATPase
VGALWENFVVSERMKMNKVFRPYVQSYFWRNYNGSEVDYIETINNHIFAYEMKWNTRKNQKVSKAFTNAYENANTQVITPLNFGDFIGV